MTRLVITLALLLSLCSCSEKKHFTIGGELENLGSQMVSIVYFADGGLKQEQVAAVNGRFALKGVSPQPTLCSVEVASFGEIATLVVANGDIVSLSGNVNEPLSIKVEGNATNRKIAQWTAENAQLLQSGNASRINQSVRDFIVANSGDMASTVLLVTRFQTPGFESLADSLLSLIDPAARPAPVIQNFNALIASQLTKHEASEINSMNLWSRNDSVYRFRPRSHSLALMAFRNPGSPTDSVARLLRDLSESYPSKRLVIVEVSTARDSVQWKQSTTRDSAQWVQTWAPGSVAIKEIERLKVPRTPFYILADSTGTQIYRGSSGKALRNTIESVINSPSSNAR